ncbi:Uncharacterized protein PCOAH_00017550 [Plasmodium coatneyi]|uniref:RNase NYN domain-containing protein n=1 Tax=Plasmodium coatneyi TaxID=208452 RepID=A0A1B1DXI8_9APIC|nr:Uncharacterized protein PCOAH_00017550 [Plasmodium coatneyi]ANQ07492.1 Uncharacterized protein PCOAH_00017550 [Plasmodium coatneyi]
MLLNRRKHGLPKRVTLVLLILTVCFKHISGFARSFAVNRSSLVLSATSGKNDSVRKAQLRENRKILVEIGNSLKEQDVKKALSNLDDLLEAYTKDNKLCRNMSTLCGNVLNLCSKYNDINNMISVIEKMKKHNIEMQENSFLAICNYYITNNYIYEYLLTINKMIQKKITIRERFYKYILVHVLDLPLGGVQSVSSAPNRTEQDIYESTHINNKRCNLIKNIDYSNFEKHVEEVEKYRIPHLSEEDKKYLLNNYLLIDIFKHMNENRVKIKLLYILKLIHYVYENVQHLIRQSEQSVAWTNQPTNQQVDERSPPQESKAKLLSGVLTDQLRDILELYKMNYESMSINIKKYDDEVDEEEKRTLYYQVNKIIKKLPFIKLTENVKNTFNCKNCEENINTYFLSLKHTIIVIVNIILITHLFNSKEIFKIKHFFSILNGVDTPREGENTKDTKRGGECTMDASGMNSDDHDSSVPNVGELPREELGTSLPDTRSTNKLFERGTYTCLLDGANIGYNKQNVENGRFSFLQIEILKEIIKKRNNETPLIILPKIYHYKNSLKHLQQCESENGGHINSSIFIPNKTIKVKKGSLLPRRGGADEGPQDNEEDLQDGDASQQRDENADRRGTHPLSYIRRMFNKLDPTDVEIIKKWESEKCLYICNYNMYDDYYYILGSLARSNNLFNICTYVDRLAKHFHKYQNLNHNVIIDNYTRSGDKETYNGREILHVYNNIIFDRNNHIMVLVSNENMNKEKKYISMNEQYYNDQIKKRKYSHVSFFEEYKNKLTFREKDNVSYSEENVFMETYLCDSRGENLPIGVGEEEAISNIPSAKGTPVTKPNKKQVPLEEASTTHKPQEKRSTEQVDGKNFYYSNIYVKCIKDVRSVQKPIYIYTNDKMKNHYFNEYTNYILKKWKKKSFISFYFKQPIFISDLLSQSESNSIDLSKLISTYKLPFVNLENPKLYIDDIVSYRDKGIYHIKINTPSKTFLSYQNENIPFLQSGNNVVRYLCIDFSKVYRRGA